MASTRDVSLYFGGTLLTQLITFVTGVMVARWIGPSEYGALSVARNIYQSLLILAPLGLDLSLLRHLGENRGNWAGSLAQVSRLRLLTGLVNLTVLIVTVAIVAPWLQAHVYRTPHLALYLDLTLLALPLAADVAILTACLRGLGAVDVQNLAALYVQPIVRTLALVAFLALGFSVAGVAASTAVGTAASCLLMSWFLQRIARRREIERRAMVLEDRKAIRRVMSYSGWLASMMWLYGVLRSVDILVLGRYRPPAVVGAYAALSTMAFTISILPSALGQTLAPRVARFYAEGDMARMRQALADYLRSAVLLSSPLFAGIAVFGPWLDLLFGARYHFTSSLSLNLAVAYLVSAALGQMGVSLTMTGRHKIEFVVLAVGTGAAFGLCILLAPRFGGNGVALGVTAGYLFTNGVRTVISARFMGGLDVSWSDLMPPLSCLALAYAWRAVLERTVPHTLVVGIAAAPMLLVLFAAAYWLLLLRPEEKDFLTRRIRQRFRRPPNPG